MPAADWRKYEVSFLKYWLNTKTADVLYSMTPKISRNTILDNSLMQLSLYPIYQQIIKGGGLPVHCGLLEKEEGGFLLVAPSGMGKSTCCRRIPSPWSSLSDDTALVVDNGRDRYNVHPLPTWSDFFYNRNCRRIWDVQKGYPLEAVFFLSRAKCDKVIPVGKHMAAACIYHSATEILNRIFMAFAPAESRVLKKQVFKNSCRLARAIPCYNLQVNLSGRFWDKIEKVINA